MPRRKIPYKIGSLVSVQDKDGKTLAVCRVEAADMKGIVIGHFFPIKGNDGLSQYPIEADSFYWRFGDLHIIQEQWPVIGFDSDFLPNPSSRFEFLNKSSVTGRNSVYVYDANASLVERYDLPKGESRDLPPNSLRGAVAVESVLKLIVAGERHPHFQW